MFEIFLPRRVNSVIFSDDFLWQVDLGNILSKQGETLSIVFERFFEKIRCLKYSFHEG